MTSEQDIKNLQDEIGDVMCMIDIMEHSGHVTTNRLKNVKKLKTDKLMKWSLLFR